MEGSRSCGGSQRKRLRDYTMDAWNPMRASQIHERGRPPEHLDPRRGSLAGFAISRERASTTPVA